MGTSIVPNLDAIDSFRVLTSNFDAEYGNSSGGQVLVTTKAGTAQMHGARLSSCATRRSTRGIIFQRTARRTGRINTAERLGGEPFQRGVTLFGDYQGTRLTEGIDTGDIAVPSDGRAGRRLQSGSAHREREREAIGRRSCRQSWGKR